MIEFKYPDFKSDFNVDPEYLRGLLEKADVSQREFARRIGVNERTVRDYMSSKRRGTVPYAIQYALECMAAMKEDGLT